MNFIEIFRRKDGQATWRIRSRNNQVVATAAEGYTRTHGARRAAARFFKTPISNQIKDLTITTKRPNRRA